MSASASLAVQRAIVAALAAMPEIAGVVSGIYDGPPPRAVFPYIAIGDGLASDWSTKTARGREIRAAITVWDDGEVPAQLHELMRASEDTLATLSGALDGWRIVSAVFLRSLIARDPAGAVGGPHRISRPRAANLITGERTCRQKRVPHSS